MAGQQVGVKCKGWNAYAGLAYFHTEDYESRVYAYERSTLYTLSFPMLYGHGIRGYVVCRADLSPSFMVIAKIGTTRYFDRSSIGSGLQTVNSNTLTDIDVQIRWRL